MLGELDNIPSAFPWTSSPAACRRALEEGDVGLDKRMKQEELVWLPLLAPLVH